MKAKNIALVMAKALILSALVTCAAVALLALMSYLLHFSDGKINIGVVVIDILACLIGGIAAGKGMREKKYLWGLLLGALYFGIMFLISVALSGKAGGSATSYITTVLICLGSGMLGGMIG